MDTRLDIEREKWTEYKREMQDVCSDCVFHGTDDCAWDGNVFKCCDAGDGPFLEP